MVTVVWIEPGCFGSNRPAVWLSLWLGGCLRGSSLRIVPTAAQKKLISYELLYLPLEKVLGPNRAVSHSRFPKPWSLPAQGANLHGVVCQVCCWGLCSAPGGICELVPGKAVTSGSRSFLPGEGMVGRN